VERSSPLMERPGKAREAWRREDGGAPALRVVDDFPPEVLKVVGGGRAVGGWLLAVIG
jgi:hypothetical protein